MVLLEQLDEAGAATQPELRKATQKVESLAIDDRVPDTAAAPDDARDAHTEQQQQQQPEEDGAFHDAADSPEALAENYKARGNEAFGRGLYVDAEQLYSSALEVAGDQLPQRAVYLANRAAARLHLARYADAVDDCTAALEVDGNYAKALLRRAQAHEKIGDLEHLELALADLRRVLEIEPSNRAAAKKLTELESAAEAKREQLKREMLDTLKGFGNTILGKFGLSLDNFKAEKDPETGSYNIQFVNGGGGGDSAAQPTQTGSIE